MSYARVLSWLLRSVLHIVPVLSLILADMSLANPVDTHQLSSKEFELVRRDITAMINTDVAAVSDFTVREATADRIRRLLPMPEFAQMGASEKANALIFAGVHNLLAFERLSDVSRHMEVWFPETMKRFRNAWLGEGSGNYGFRETTFYGPFPEWRPESAAFMLAWNCVPQLAWLQPDRFPFAKRTVDQLRKASNSIETAMPLNFSDRGSQHDLEFARCIQEIRMSHGSGLFSLAQRNVMSLAVTEHLAGIFARQLAKDHCTGKGPDDCVMVLLLWSDLVPGDRLLARTLQMLEAEVGLVPPDSGVPGKRPEWSSEASPEGDRFLREGAFLRAKMTSVLAVPDAWPTNALPTVHQQVVNWERWGLAHVAPSQRYDIDDNEYADPHVPEQRRKAGLPLNGFEKVVADATPAPVSPAQQKVSESRYDQDAPLYAQINWSDPFNPEFADLGNDELLIRTTKGLQWWDIQRNRFKDVDGGPYPSDRVRLHRSARVPGGAFIVMSSTTDRQHRGANPSAMIVWWDGQDRRLAATLPWTDRSEGNPVLRPLGKSRALVCHGALEEKVARMRVIEMREGRIEWVTQDSQELRVQLQQAYVDGDVWLGSESIQVSSSSGVGLSTRTCQWVFKQLPSGIQGFNWIAMEEPVFLEGGKILIMSVAWGDGSGRNDISSPLAWEPAKAKWTTPFPQLTDGSSFQHIYHANDRAAWRAVGNYQERLNTELWRWERTLHRIGREWMGDNGGAYSLWPLSDGRALVFNRNVNSNHPDYAKGGQVVMMSVHDEVGPVRGRLAFSHDAATAISAGGGHAVVLGEHIEQIDLRRRASRELPQLPVAQKYASVVATSAQDILLFGGLPAGCQWNVHSSSPDHLADARNCHPMVPLPMYRLAPGANAWTEVTEIRLPYAKGTHSYQRTDAIMRAGGELMYLMGPGLQDWLLREKNFDYSRSSSELMSWKVGSTRNLGTLRRARSEASLLELRDGRLAVAGGKEQIRRAASPEECKGEAATDYCPYVLQTASTTEVFDSKTRKWSFGPAPKILGGHAVRLTNGRIVKIHWYECGGGPDLCGEISDPDFRSWRRLPSPPEMSEWDIGNVYAVGNKVVMVPYSGSRDRRIRIWDDTRFRWDVWQQWPARQDWADILPADEKHALVIHHDRSFALAAYPD